MADPRFARGRFMEDIIDPNNVTIKDITSFQFFDFFDFIKNRITRFHTVKADEVGAPDLIAYREYNDEQLYWVILITNNIIDPVSGIVAGAQLKIPRLIDIETFLQSQRAAQIQNTTVQL